MSQVGIPRPKRIPENQSVCFSVGGADEFEGFIGLRGGLSPISKTHVQELQH